MRLFLLLVLWLMGTTARGQSWQVGTARVNITPEQPIQMAGYGSRNHPADGKLTELWGKAVVLDDAAGARGVLITLDLVGIHRDTADRICQRLDSEYSLRREQVAINCSHTHTGPAVGHNLAPLHYLMVPLAQQSLLDEYENWLVDRLVSMVGQAIGDVTPCSLTWGSGLCTVAVNRRNNPAAEVPQRRAAGNLIGPYDHDVPVLAVRDEQGQLKTIVFGYACHATVLSSRQWSGDYPGFAQLEVERRYPGVNAMFWAGCGADQNPLPRREVELARKYGQRLANAVAEVIEGTMHSVEAILQTRRSEIELPLTDLPTVQQLHATLQSDPSYERARAQYLLERLGDRSELESSYRYPVASWKIGKDIRFVLLGGEVVVDYALRLKSTATGTPDDRPEMIWVAGYSNDVMAYIPSRRVLAEGGYEGGGSNVYYGLPGLWSPEIENLIVAEVQSQWAADRR